MTSAAGRVAVVTGASTGLGAGMAATFADAGVRVAACARREPTVDGAPDALTAALDVTDEAAVVAFCDHVAGELGAIDLWVNNAGILGEIRPLRDTPVDDFARNIEVNLLGVVHGTQAFVRHRRAVGGGGVLVNISSGASQRGIAGWAAYCAAKAGVDRVTEVVAIEEADVGLRAYAVAPGLVDTGMQEQIRSASADVFPTVARYRDAKRDGAFNSPSHVGRWILELAFGDAAGGGDAVVRRVPDDPAAVGGA